MSHMAFGIIWIIFGLVWIKCSSVQYSLGHKAFGSLILVGGIGIIITGIALCVS